MAMVEVNDRVDTGSGPGRGLANIQGSDISVVIQGDIRPTTSACIEAVQRVFPGAQLILATYADAIVPAGFAGTVVRVTDPGDQPPITRSARAPRSNTNRQIATTRGGLALATRLFILKLRSDALLRSDRIAQIWAEAHAMDPARSRLVIPSFFTRNPHGVSGYLFHASDWFMFGEAARVRSFWETDFVPDADVTWFDTRRHALLSTPTARRYRARIAPEQHLSIGFARQLGYRVPAVMNDRSGDLVTECEKFFAREFVIAPPEALDCVLEKYAAMTNSRFQRIDCVLYEDWIALCRRHAPELSGGVPSLPVTPGEVGRRRLSLAPVWALRHLISVGALWSIRRRRLRAERAARQAG